MKRLAIVLSVLALAACDRQPEGQPIVRTQLGDAVPTENAPDASPTDAPEDAPQVVSACSDVTFENIPLTHCVADPAQHRIVTRLGEAGSGPFRSLAAFADTVDKNTIAFAMNAGMYGDDIKPIGYYVEDGERLKELNRADGPGNFHMKPNGVFYGTGGSWSVLSADRFFSSVRDRPNFGTQSGPMLVIDGKLHPDFQDDGPSRAVRNGVGVSADGKAHFVISNASISFGQFARYFRDELKTPNALFLDGNVSSLWDPATNRLDRGLIGPMIVVTRREVAE
ncbi:phosphodiester glycosidase family protein [Erythrobacter sp. JK5]|uniref:phosphodiester glycosidase family protein n=1 Tax=Erythrobacter sp. JK5 TaxID=2829500 RepID=UPI002013A0DE|nr:phosphodiester glycosidase family protein [Erythrobacter sp. JK5]